MAVPHWNATFTAGDDLSHVDFINMFVDAINERFATNSQNIFFSPLPHVSAGDLLEAMNAVFGGNLFGSAYSTPAQFQAICQVYCTAFYQPSLVAALNGTLGTPGSNVATTTGMQWTWAKLKTDLFGGTHPLEFANNLVGTYIDGASFVNGDYARQIDDGITYHRVAGAWVNAAGHAVDTAAGHGWTRKYPREYASAASTAYSDTRPFTDGEYARNLATGFVTHRVSGAWVVVTDETPPDAVTTYGYIAEGDYLGPWIWSELRDVINQFIWNLWGGGEWLDTGSAAYSGGGSNALWATAQANATAAFGPVGGTTTIPRSASSGILGAGYTASLETYTVATFRIQRFTAASNGSAPTICDFYGWILPIAYDAVLHPVFDDQGIGMTQNTWKSLFSVSATGSATGYQSFALPFGSSTAPPWCADPTVDLHTSRGYTIDQIFILFRGDVAGGYAYTLATP